MEQTTRRFRRRNFWLIAEDGANYLLSVDLPGSKGEGALAVFSFEEEAKAYLRLGVSRGHCHVEEVGCKQLLSMLLSGAYRYFRWVALDPMAEQLCAPESLELVSIRREDFLALLVSRWADSERPTAGVGAGTPRGTTSER